MSETMTAASPWLTPDEAAAYLRVSRRTIYTWMAGGIVRWFPLPCGGGRRLRRGDLDALLERGAGERAQADQQAG